MSYKCYRVIQWLGLILTVVQIIFLIAAGLFLWWLFIYSCGITIDKKTTVGVDIAGAIWVVVMVAVIALIRVRRTRGR